MQTNMMSILDEEENNNMQKPLRSARNNKTQKVKRSVHALPKHEKILLWEKYYRDRETLECVYANNKNDPSTPPPPSLPPDIDLCYLCNHTLIVDEGFPTCSNPECCVIYRETLDYSAEWRFYGADDKHAADPTRCGNPINPLLVESSFGCKVLSNHRSSYEMKKIRKWTEWQSMPHSEKALFDEFQFITLMANQAGIPKIFIDDAISIHKDIRNQKMFRGFNRDGIKAASIYLSCRLNGCPRTPHEIAEIFKLDKASATHGCSTAVQILTNMERDVDPLLKTQLCRTTPIMFMERFCSKLQVPAEPTMLCKFVAKKVEEGHLIDDNTPISIVAGILYFVMEACQLASVITKLDIKNVCGVSEVTITKCYKKLDPYRDSLIPAVVQAKYQKNQGPTLF